MTSLAEDFALFWESYPRHIGKLAAEREYCKARRRDSAESILAGLERFKRNLPDEARFIPHARTWLFQGRWMDEDDAPVIVPAKEYWGDECNRLHGGQCPKQWTHAMKMRESA